MLDEAKSPLLEPSSRAGGTGVKRSRFEGWELGLLAIGIALTGALIAVPREVAPTEIPMPVVDDREVARADARDTALAAALGPALERSASGSDAGGEPDLFDLKALGSAFRRYGMAELTGEGVLIARERSEVGQAVAAAKTLGTEKLLALRAYEKQWFLAELRRWEQTGIETDELRGLGGTFLRVAAQSGWLDARRALLMPEVVRGILFKRRWNDVLGVSGAAFDLRPDESKALYRFLLENPWAGGVDQLGIDRASACRIADRWRLRKLDELKTIDALYPVDLARGVLLYRLGDAAAAVQAFRAQLTRTPDGSYTLRTRNYLKAALARAGQQAGP